MHIINLTVVAHLRVAIHKTSCPSIGPVAGPCDCGPGPALVTEREAHDLAYKLTEANWNLKDDIEKLMHQFDNLDRSIKCIQHSSVAELSKRLEALEAERFVMRELMNATLAQAFAENR